MEKINFTLKNLITFADEQRSDEESDVYQELKDLEIPFLKNVPGKTTLYELTDESTFSEQVTGLRLSDRGRVIVSEIFTRFYNLMLFATPKLQFELSLADLRSISYTELYTDWLNHTQKLILVDILAESSIARERVLPVPFSLIIEQNTI